jgi:hypothetical protein
LELVFVVGFLQAHKLAQKYTALLPLSFAAEKERREYLQNTSKAHAQFSTPLEQTQHTLPASFFPICFSFLTFTSQNPQQCL